jgi:hypothetical protein
MAQHSYERDYEPAYRFGWQARSRYVDKQWEDVQDELQRDWEAQRGTSSLSWVQAREACQNAWSHVLRESASSDQPGLEQVPPNP